MKKIYLAGGWFTPEQAETHDRVLANLQSTNNFEIFNPRTMTIIDASSTDEKMTKSLIANIEGVLDADVVVALVDKPYDSGTVWETGLAYGKTPVVYYAERLNGKPFNLMLAKTGKFAGNVDELLQVLNEDDTYEINSVYDFEGEIE